MDTKRIQLYFFISLLVLVIALTARIFLPFLAPIALAFMFAVAFRPVHRWNLRKLGQRRGIASVATILFILIVVALPFSLVASQLFSETTDFYFNLREGGVAGLDRMIATVVDPIKGFYPSFDLDVDGFLETVTGSIVDNLGKIFSGTASIIIGFFIGLISLFYILKDGASFRRVMIELSPLSDRYDVQIITRLESAIMSVVKGSLLTALIQGCFVGIGFAIFGIQHVFLWGAVAALGALLPGIGTGIVMIPAVLYLLASGSTGMAIGLALWGVIAVGLVDNFLQPYFVGHGFHVHPIFVLLAALGGIIFFGPVGLFLGPLTVALLFALVDIYKLLILDDQHKKVTSL